MGIWDAAASFGGSLLGGVIGSKSSRRQRTDQNNLNQKQLDEQRYEFDAQLQAEADALGLSKEQLLFQKQQFGEGQRIQGLRENAYSDLLNRGKTMGAEGENQFMGETAAGTPEDIKKMQGDIAAGTAESMQAGAGQMAAAMAKQGVRGGQAVTQMRRGIGEMAVQGQRDINTMASQEEARKRQLRAAYEASKAQSGNTATLSSAPY